MQGLGKKVTWFLEKACLVSGKRSFGCWKDLIWFFDDYFVCSRSVFLVTTNSVLRYSEECLRL